MKKYFIVVASMVLCSGIVVGQETYKMNVLTLLDKVPAVETCNAAFDMIPGTNSAGKQFREVRATADSAQAELARLQYALNTAMTSSVGPSMSAEDAKALGEKMENMSDEEKQKWAMENAAKFMPSNAGHVSKDMNNTPVNDAVGFVTKAQELDLMYYAAPSDCMQKFAAIEMKNKATIESAQRKFESESGQGQTIIAEGTEKMWEAKYAAALKEYRSTILPIYGNEIREKREYLKQLGATLVSKATPTEKTIASTHYGDDARENVNKSHLILAHFRVLGKVQEFLAAYGEIFKHYADAYAALLELEPKKN